MNQQDRFQFARDEQLAPPTPAQSSSHASRKSAERLKASGRQGEKMRRLLKAYADAGERGLISAEVERLAGLRVSSICSLRHAAIERGWLVAVGERMGPFGTEQTVHRITDVGRQAR